MQRAGVRVGVGTRFVLDGEVAEVVEVAANDHGVSVGLRIGAGRRMVILGLRELLDSRRARPIADCGDTSADERGEPASIILAELSAVQRARVLERAGHIREVLTGYRAGSVELAAAGEPRTGFDPCLPLTRRYEAKAAELGVGVRTIKQWVSLFRADGEAGLAPKPSMRRGVVGNSDERWVETALEVMVEHVDQSRPSRTMVIERTNARVVARFGEGVVRVPSRATAFRVLEQLERRHPTFRLSTKRNRDIAARPAGVYGKLRPTRPGEYLLMDTTRLDVFAVDPVTLRWVQAELTVGMDWYTRCVVGIRVTPVSTKAVDAAATLYQAFRPRPAGKDWPAHAVWPEHGIPRSLLVDVEAIDGPMAGAASPAIVPETVVIDHGKIYVSEHLTSVCQRMGISIQPARLRTGRDKGPVERFFRTIREDLLQALPGYKGPDVHSRGLAPESEAFFYLDELEDIIREWVAVVYHHRPHEGLLDPHLPTLELSPAMMFEHGMARAGYIEVPRDPDLAYEFLRTHWRTIQHYGVEIAGRRYNGPGLDPYRNVTSGYGGAAHGRWPIQVDSDDITRVYFRDPDSRRWHTLEWEHAPSLQMPFSEDALVFARRLAKEKYTYPDDRIAVADLLERWSLGLGSSMQERRVALRLSREPADLEVTAAAPSAEVGDDDSDDELDLPGGDPGAGPIDEDDFYAEALEDV